MIFHRVRSVVLLLALVLATAPWPAVAQAQRPEDAGELTPSVGSDAGRETPDNSLGAQRDEKPAGRPDQDVARDAVVSGQAMELGELLNRIGISRELIDAHLVRRDGRLIYELEVLSEDGVVRTLLYDAQSGKHL